MIEFPLPIVHFCLFATEGMQTKGEVHPHRDFAEYLTKPSASSLEYANIRSFD